MPADIGYAFSSEEHLPNDMVRHARLAEEAGFTWGLISDHFHPWHDEQGQSPFVWSVIGGIAQATERFRIGTGVTCPLIRIHPAVVAQAAATSAAMMGPGRFFLGVGTGENLNEHVTQGEYTTIRGDWFEVDGARIYTLPEEPIELYVAAGATNVAQLAGEAGDGLIAVEADQDVVEDFDEAGGKGKPKIGMVHGCWAERREDALETALRVWPQSGLKGPLNQDLRLPADFMAAAEIVEPKHLEGAMPLGNDVDEWRKEIASFEDAGFTQVYIHNVGPDQEGFLRWAGENLL
jgi:alkanesulfonate monooxygenase SsuD/methylene tetrahydromethanopterin reductase-like flavin-dependent oxidoreductase (luciferase family)